MCSMTYAPAAIPAAMRWAISCVLPDPAPASTRRLRSKVDAMRSRASMSRRTGLLMGPQPVSCRHRGIAHLLLNALHRQRRPARARHIAELAVAIVGRVGERPGRNHIAQLAQHFGEIGSERRGNRPALA